MQKRAFQLKIVTLALITLLVAQVYAVSALPRQENQKAPKSSRFLQFGQSLALADFDGDDRLDKATLSGTGHNKSLEIRLSHTKARTLLHFDTLSNERGSLFAKDVDNDGDNDLIWTDLLHPDDVVIWLDDGTGHFERGCPHQYAQDFVLSDAPAFEYPDNSHQDTVFSPHRDPSPSLSPGQKVYHLARTKIFARAVQHSPIADGCFQTCFVRGPPSLL